MRRGYSGNQQITITRNVLSGGARIKAAQSRGGWRKAAVVYSHR